MEKAPPKTPILKNTLFMAMSLNLLEHPSGCKECGFSVTSSSSMGLKKLILHFNENCPTFMRKKNKYEKF